MPTFSRVNNKDIFGKLVVVVEERAPTAVLVTGENFEQTGFCFIGDLIRRNKIVGSENIVEVG